MLTLADLCEAFALSLPEEPIAGSTAVPALQAGIKAVIQTLIDNAPSANELAVAYNNGGVAAVRDLILGNTDRAIVPAPMPAVIDNQALYYKELFTKSAQDAGKLQKTIWDFRDACLSAGAPRTDDNVTLCKFITDMGADYKKQQKDLKDAAGELAVTMPPAGTVIAKMLSANVLLKHENSTLLSRAVDAEKEQVRLGRCTTEYLKQLADANARIVIQDGQLKAIKLDADMWYKDAMSGDVAMTKAADILRKELEKTRKDGRE